MEHPNTVIPARSTIHALLDANNLVKRRSSRPAFKAFGYRGDKESLRASKEVLALLKLEEKEKERKKEDDQ